MVTQDLAETLKSHLRREAGTVPKEAIKSVYRKVWDSYLDLIENGGTGIAFDVPGRFWNDFVQWALADVCINKVRTNRIHVLNLPLVDIFDVKFVEEIASKKFILIRGVDQRTAPFAQKLVSIAPLKQFHVGFLDINGKPQDVLKAAEVPCMLQVRCRFEL